MITIQLDYDVDAAAEARVRKLLDDTALRDVDFNGFKYAIKRGDGTCILGSGGCDPYDVARLFQAIQSEIAGTRQGSDDGWCGDSTGKVWRE